MKRYIIITAAGIGIILLAAFLLSLLGHYEIWIFKNSFNDNLFVTGGILFGLGLFTQSNTSQFAKGASVMYSGHQEKPEQHRGAEKGRLGLLISLTVMFIIVCVLSFLLPDIRI